MWTLHTANAEHWVPVATVASFKRMREHAARGLEWVVAGLRARSDVLEVDESGARVRRRAEVKEPKDGFDRSVYVVSAGFACWFLGGGRLMGVRVRVERVPGRDARAAAAH